MLCFLNSDRACVQNVLKDKKKIPLRTSRGLNLKPKQHRQKESNLSVILTANDFFIDKRVKHEKNFDFYNSHQTQFLKHFLSGPAACKWQECQCFSSMKFWLRTKLKFQGPVA